MLKQMRADFQQNWNKPSKSNVIEPLIRIQNIRQAYAHPNAHLK